MFFFRQIISGIDYLHKNSITHRDIKPANIILDAKQQVPKLIDFGFTNIFDEVRTHAMGALACMCVYVWLDGCVRVC